MSTAPISPPKYDTVALLNQGEKDTYVKQMSEKQTQQAFIYQIKGRPVFAFGDIFINQNQKIICDSTALLWMDGDLQVETECSGGCVPSFLRKLSGEPCCFNTFTANTNGQKVTVGFELPGDLMAFGVTPKNGWVVTSTAFVAGTSNLKVACRFSSCLACCCGDEAVFLTKVSVDEGDQAVFLAGGYGMIERHDIPEGQTFLVSRGLFFAAHETTQFEVGLIGGVKNCLCTGGGIVYKFKGPSCVYTQSRNPVQLRRDFGLGPKGKAVTALKILLKVLVIIAKSQGK